MKDAAPQGYRKRTNTGIVTSHDADTGPMSLRIIKAQAKSLVERAIAKGLMRHRIAIGQQAGEDKP